MQYILRNYTPRTKTKKKFHQINTAAFKNHIRSVNNKNNIKNSKKMQ